MSCTSCLPRQ